MDIFYLKYRPKVIAELDLTRVRERLKKILQEPNLPHSFLFSGPKGIGKTSAARILAKSLNCPFAKKGNPCGRCDVCLEIERGESLDVLEIDAASNRGIDDIRQLKEKIGLQPLKSKNKVYIIDEVHMLTREAFNAILKTLEEPPPHVYFVFCTTNPEKIPATVLSRLTTIEFDRASEAEIVSALGRVVAGEGIKIEKEVLLKIAQAAEGSFRDAHKIFYQLWLETGKKITRKNSKKFLNHLFAGRPEEFLKLVGEGKIKEVLFLLEELTRTGVDFSNYGKRVLSLLQEIILFHFGRKELNGAEKKVLVKIFSPAQVLALSKMISQALGEQKTAVLPQLPLQLKAVEFYQRFFSSEKKEKEVKARKKEVVRERKSLSPERNIGGDFSSQWNQVLTVVKPMNHSVSALLRSCRPLGVKDGCLTLEVFYQFHKDRLSEERNRQILEAGIEKVFGQKWRVRYVLGQKRPTVKKAEEKGGKRGQSSSPSTKEEELYQVAKEIFGE